jgi:hypothetical protein
MNNNREARPLFREALIVKDFICIELLSCLSVTHYVMRQVIFKQGQMPAQSNHEF